MHVCMLSQAPTHQQVPYLSSLPFQYKNSVRPNIPFPKKIPSTIHPGYPARG